jgi:hypothetical protein
MSADRPRLEGHEPLVARTHELIRPRRLVIRPERFDAAHRLGRDGDLTRRIWKQHP